MVDSAYKTNALMTDRVNNTLLKTTHWEIQHTKPSAILVSELQPEGAPNFCHTFQCETGWGGGGGCVFIGLCRK